MKCHKVELMEYKGKLEGVALTNTEFLNEQQRITVLKGGSPLIPFSVIDSYLQEVKLCAKVIKHLDSTFKNKDIAKAKAYCEKQGATYSIITD